MNFTENIQSAHIECSQGKTYISTTSGTTLNVLHWITVVGVIAGATCLNGAVSQRRWD